MGELQASSLETWSDVECLVLHGRVFLGGGIRRAAIRIDRGLITYIGLNPNEEGCRRYHFDRGHLIMPGMVDLHVHFRDWDLASKETMRGGARAALAGGVVGVGDMPNTRPFIRTAELAARRLSEGSALPIDYRLHGGVPEDLEEVRKYVELGLRSIKVYPEDVANFGEEHVKKLFSLSAALGLTLVVHCEDPYAEAESPEGERRCVDWVLHLSSKYGARVHITHASTPYAVLAAHKHKPLVSVDVTPHHLLLSADGCLKRNPPGYCKVRPPLRGEETRRELLVELSLGRIDAVASDHAPHTREEKLSDSPPPGICSLELVLPLLLDLWRRGVLSLEDLVRLYSSYPAKLLGIGVRLGVGEPARIVVVENKPCVIDEGFFEGSCRFSPLVGLRAGGRVKLTVTPRAVYERSI